MGAYAVFVLQRDQSHKMMGEIQGELVLTPFEQTATQPKTVAAALVSLLTELARFAIYLIGARLFPSPFRELEKMPLTYESKRSTLDMLRYS
jgi:hypothetical protein